MRADFPAVAELRGGHLPHSHRRPRFGEVTAPNLLFKNIMNAIQQKIQTAFAAILTLLVGLTLTLVSCKDKSNETMGEKIEDKIDDALDRRPNEKIRDVAEDIEDAAKDVKESVKDAVEK